MAATRLAAAVCLSVASSYFAGATRIEQGIVGSFGEVEEEDAEGAEAEASEGGRSGKGQGQRQRRRRRRRRKQSQGGTRQLRGERRRRRRQQNQGTQQPQNQGAQQIAQQASGQTRSIQVSQQTTPGNFPGGKCGIATNPGQCSQDLAKLGGSFSCFMYGGPSDPCTLNIQNDADAGMGKDPSECDKGVLFLWDEPYTQAERGKPGWDSMSFIVGKWMAYSQKWSSGLLKFRSAGGKVTTPFFTDKGGAKASGKLKDFMQTCSACKEQGAAKIDVAVWNAWIGDWSPDTKGQADYIKSQSQEIGRTTGLPVWLGNFGFLGASGSPAKQVQAINSGVIGDPSIERVYYFAANDVGGGSPVGSNTFDNADIKAAFLSKCGSR